MGIEKEDVAFSMALAICAKDFARLEELLGAARPQERHLALAIGSSPLSVCGLLVKAGCVPGADSFKALFIRPNPEPELVAYLAKRAPAGLDRRDNLLAAMAYCKSAGRTRPAAEALFARLGADEVNEALYFACSAGNLPMAEAALAAGADPNVSFADAARPGRGKTPLEAALDFGHAHGAGQKGQEEVEKIACALLDAGGLPWIGEGAKPAADQGKKKLLKKLGRLGFVGVCEAVRKNCGLSEQDIEVCLKLKKLTPFAEKVLFEGLVAQSAPAPADGPRAKRPGL